MLHIIAQPLKNTFLLSFGLLMATNDVLAHQDASDPDFCSHDDKFEVGTVTLSGNSLEGLLKDQAVDCPIGVKELRSQSNPTDKELREYVGAVLINRNSANRSHDAFDIPSAQFAYAYASCVCASMANQDYDASQIRPLIQGPEILFSANHHETYDLTDGIEFSCHVCKRSKK